ncbi:MAG: hypothetical protein ACRDRJ_20665 [Streptosporangiaceae bacterium]
MNDQHDTIDRVRAIMAAANPVPVTAGEGSAADPRGVETLSRVLAQRPGEAGQAGPHRLHAANRRARRVIAPLGAGLAVAALVTGLTLVAQSPKAPASRSVAGAPTAAGQGTPRFYVALSEAGRAGQLVAAVHNSQTGRVLSYIRVPGPFLGLPSISTDGSDRSFVIAQLRQVRAHGKDVTGLYRLRVSADGRSEKLARLPVNLPADSNEVIDSTAVSPDGSQLAVGLQSYKGTPSGLNSRGEIVVYSLTGGPTRTWTAPGDVPALPFSLDWISKSQIAFVWQDQLKGSATYFFTGRSQIRVLDTSAPGHAVLASRVLLNGGGKLGFIQSASVGPDGSPINVATFRVTSIGGTGTATMVLAQVSPNGAVNKAFATYTRSYSGLPQEGKVTTPCQVLTTDTTGLHTLATCPAFGRIDDGAFTTLAHGSADLGAAW